MNTTTWEIPDTILPEALVLARDLNISPVTAQILVNRGIKTATEARKFLYPDPADLLPPAAIPGLEEALVRLIRAVNNREKVLVYGDYDVDGLTATAIMLEVLQRLSVDTQFYLPDRFIEGYGLHISGLRYALEKGCSLVVTVDCGITSVDEAAWAKANGLDLIITDHHRPGTELPEGAVLVNPMLKGDNPQLCGAGVAFKVSQSLAEHFGLAPEDGITGGWAIDLAALGTIADAVPLLGENRLLVQLGLEYMSRKRRPGIQALANVSGLKEKVWSARELAFALIPRLNACGRTAKADPSLELLLTVSTQRAMELARHLHRENQVRKLLEDGITVQAEAMAAVAVARGDRGIVLAGEGWHPGVIGIVSARLAERFNRPVIVIALEGEKGRGSGRSIPGCNLYEILERCSSNLILFGGHNQAAGLEIEAAKVADFQLSFNKAIEEMMRQEPPLVKIEPEAEVLFSRLDWSLLEELESLAPFGEGNPRPLLFYRRSCIKTARQVGKEEAHLKLVLTGEGRDMSAIGFKMELPPGLSPGDQVDVAFFLDRNFYRDREEIQLLVKAIRPLCKIKPQVPAAEEIAAAGEGSPLPAWCSRILNFINEGTVPKNIIFQTGTAVNCCYSGLARTLHSFPFTPFGPWMGKGAIEWALNQKTGLITCTPFCEGFVAVEKADFVVSALVSREDTSARILRFNDINYCWYTEITSLITKLQEKNKRILIYTRDANSMSQVAAKLTAAFPEQRPVMDYYSDMRQMLLVYRDAAAGQMPLFIGVGDNPAWFYPADAVIFEYLPANREEVELSLPMTEILPEVYIKTQDNGVLETDLRHELACFYRSLHKKADKTGEINIIDNRDYYQRCFLAILEELELVRVSARGRDLKISMLEAGTRRDLMTSRRFQQLLTELDTARAFLHQLRMEVSFR